MATKDIFSWSVIEIHMILFDRTFWNGLRKPTQS